MSAVIRPAALVAGPGAAILCIAAILVGLTVPGVLDRVGSGVLWALPLSKFVFNAAGALTLGALMLVLLVLPAAERTAVQVLRWAGASAVIWAAAAGTFTVANFQLVTNQPAPFGEVFAAGFLPFLTQVDVGRLGLTAVLLTSGTAVLLCVPALARHRAGLWTAAGLAVAAVVPLVLNSHATGGADHSDSTTSIVLHATAASVWIGGLVVLTALHRLLPVETRATAVERYSAVALVCFVTLGLTGLVAAWGTLGSVENLSSDYGLLLMTKAGAFLLLGVLGGWHRNAVVGRLRNQPDVASRLFTRLAMVELVVMGAAFGLAAVLARTETPSSSAAVSDAARGLPAPVPAEILVRWEPDPWWVLICGFSIAWYVHGARQLKSWPVHRTLLWVAGIGLLFVVTNAAPHAYQGFIFSAHVLSQMLLTVLVPLFLVPAAPLELARRALPARTDGSFGGRALADGLVSFVLNRALAAPYTAVVVLALTFVAFYYSPLLEWSARSQLGYGLMSTTALASGCLVTAVAVRALSRVALVGVLLATGVVFAVYGWALATQALTLERPWYTVYGRLWADSPAADPARAGELIWILGAGWIAVTAAAGGGWFRAGGIVWAHGDDRSARAGQDVPGPRRGECSCPGRVGAFRAAGRHPRSPGPQRCRQNDGGQSPDHPDQAG